LFATLVRVIIPWITNIIFAGKKRKEVINLFSWKEFLKEILFYWAVLFVFFYFGSLAYEMESNGTVRIIIGMFFFSLLLSADFIIKPIFYRYISSDYEVDTVLTNQLKVYSGLNNIEVGILHKDLKNAFAMGIKPFKQIIEIGQPLIEQLTEEEQKAIVFHELGHIKYNHLIYSFLFNIFVSTIYWISLQNTQKLPFFEEYEFPLVMLNAFILVLGIILTLFFQRRLELQADAYSASIVGVEQYEQALKKLDEITNGELSKGNLSHPKLQERIAHIKKAINNELSN
jgi:Zn-dependent protease with chaperone function